MKVLKNSELQTIEQMFSLSQMALKKAVTTILKSNYKEVIATNDYVVAKGDIPIALVAHLDTVFSTPPKNIFYDQRKGVLISPEGLGADDRAGVYAILQIVKSGLRPHIIFTTDEERGCIGASVLAQLECPFDYLKFCIELDRRGTNDCVFYDCDNPEFVNYISSFGFIEAWGTYSDICEICPAWGIAGVNLSIGYQDEHSYGEVLFIEPWFKTIEKVKNILQDNTSIAYKYIPFNYYDTYGWNGSLIKNKDLNYGNSSLTKAASNFRYGKKIPCGKCKTLTYPEETFPVVNQDGENRDYCMNCISSDSVDWCYVCGKAFELGEEKICGQQNYLCDDCLSIIRKGGVDNERV